MVSMTETGTLDIGLEQGGTWHKEFELRLPTLEDVEVALEQAGEGACQARINRHVWARTVLRIGAVTEITPGLLAGLADVEFGVLNAAEERLRKKLRAASAASPS